MMERSEILEAYDRELRIELEIPGARREALPGLVRYLRPAPAMNYISYSQLDEAVLDRVIEEQIAFFSPMDQPFSWHVHAHDKPEGLKERLLLHGFGDDEDPDAVMGLNLAEASPDLLKPVTSTVRRLHRREQLEDVAKVEARVWGGDFDWLVERLGPHLEIPDYLSVYVAYAGGRAAAAGWVYFYPSSQFAALYGGATLAELRGRGLYTAILSARLQEALRRDYRYLVTGASPMSRPILEKNGFQLLTLAYAHEWMGRTG
jgi:GNAT superfamily N-acetyltransferase